MTIDLRRLRVEYAFGELREVDARKDVANTIHQRTADIGVDDLARTLYYSDKPVEIPAGMVAEVRRIIKGSDLVVYVKRALLARLDNE